MAIKPVDLVKPSYNIVLTHKSRIASTLRERQKHRLFGIEKIKSTYLTINIVLETEEETDEYKVYDFDTFSLLTPELIETGHFDYCPMSSQINLVIKNEKIYQAFYTHFQLIELEQHNLVHCMQHNYFIKHTF